jgi:hypothetical protein
MPRLLFTPPRHALVSDVPPTWKAGMLTNSTPACGH